MSKSIPVLVKFHGDTLSLLDIDNKPYFAVKPVCDALSINWSAQYRRIERNPVLGEGVAVTAVPSSGGIQKTVCLPLNMLNGWLFGISVSRVENPEIRTKLIKYQRECFEVLNNYWNGKESQPTPPAPSTPAPAKEFSFPFEKHIVRAVTLEGELWFIAEDLKSVFMYAHLSRMLGGGVFGNMQKAVLFEGLSYLAVNLDGFFNIVRKSRRSSKVFQLWMTHTVMPLVASGGASGDVDGSPLAPLEPTPPVVVTVVSPDSLKRSGRLLIRYDSRGEASAKEVPDTACIIDIAREGSVRSVILEMPKRMYPVILEVLAKHYREANGAERCKVMLSN